MTNFLRCLGGGESKWRGEIAGGWHRSRGTISGLSHEGREQQQVEGRVKGPNHDGWGQLQAEDGRLQVKGALLEARGPFVRAPTRAGRARQAAFLLSG